LQQQELAKFTGTKGWKATLNHYKNPIC
jgi:hypothetical protein